MAADRHPHRAHRAAYPERFPVSDATKEMYPALKHGENYKQSTPVHLQVYDGILFPPPATISIRCSFPLRCSSCPSDSLSLHDSRKILLPRDGFVRQARYDTTS